GTSLAWPATPALPEWAFYPSTAALTAKIDFHTPRWKWPFWVWTKRFGAWPFSVEWLSAAFDYNAAPFFQSFVEVRVEPSAERARRLPWGPPGRPRGGRSPIFAAVAPGRPPARGAGRDRRADAPALGGAALRPRFSRPRARRPPGARAACRRGLPRGPP